MKDSSSLRKTVFAALAVNVRSFAEKTPYFTEKRDGGEEWGMIHQEKFIEKKMC